MALVGMWRVQRGAGGGLRLHERGQDCDRQLTVDIIKKPMMLYSPLLDYLWRVILEACFLFRIQWITISTVETVGRGIICLEFRNSAIGQELNTVKHRKLS